MMGLSEWLRQQPDYADPNSPSSPLPGLYADLAAHRNSNRSSFEASVAWWKRTLAAACLAGAQPAKAGGGLLNKGKGTATLGGGGGIETRDRLILHVDQALLDGFTLEEVGRPLGLGSVVRELQANGDLIGSNLFLSTLTPLPGPSKRPARSLAQRAASLAVSPLTWAISQLSLSLGLDNVDSEASEEDWRRAKGDWVLWENVETIAEAALSHYYSSPRLSPLECLFSLKTFAKELVEPALLALHQDQQQQDLNESPRLSDADLQILLQFLSRDKGLALVKDGVVKLGRTRDESIAAKSITEHEKGVVHVRDTHAALEKQVEEIEKRIADRQERITKSLKAGSKTQAMSYLRSKKALEALLDKRVSSLETLHGVILKIEQAAGDAEIMSAYDLSTSTLKTLLSDARLQPDRIDSSMEAMQETLANADEIRQAVEVGQVGMQKAAGVEQEIDEDDIERELAALQDEVETESRQVKEKGKENAASVTLPQQSEQTQASSTEATKHVDHKEHDQVERTPEKLANTQSKEPIPAS